MLQLGRVELCGVLVIMGCPLRKLPVSIGYLIFERERESTHHTYQRHVLKRREPYQTNWIAEVRLTWVTSGRESSWTPSKWRFLASLRFASFIEKPGATCNM